MAALGGPDADVLPGTAALPLAGEGAEAINGDGKRRRPAAPDAVAAAAGAHTRAEMFHKGLASTLWTAKRHIDPTGWRARRPSTRTSTGRQDWQQWP
jgi:hypothetical protein